MADLVCWRTLQVALLLDTLNAVCTGRAGRVGQWVPCENHSSDVRFQRIERHVWVVKPASAAAKLVNLLCLSIHCRIHGCSARVMLSKQGALLAMACPPAFD